MNESNAPAQQICRWHGHVDAAAIQKTAAMIVLAAAAEAIAARGRFTLVLAGGSTPRGLYEHLRDAEADWSAWQVYLGDERCLPVGDPDRNSTMIDKTWLDHVPIPRDQIHRIPAELGPKAAALAFRDTLQALAHDDFDCVLLGLGEDGHTASLFPGHDWGTAADAPHAVAVFGAPKPPPQRVSLSAARLSRARRVLCLVAGESKRDAVTRWRAGEPLPVASIQPAVGMDILIEAALLEASAGSR